MAGKEIKVSNTYKQQNNFKLNAQWLKNATRSLGSNAAGVLQDISPNIYGVVDSAAQLTRTFQRSKISQNAVARAMEKNRYIKMGKTALNNAMKDLKTGNFDNSSRSGFGGGDSGDESTSYHFGEIEDDSGDGTGQIQAVVNFNPEGLNSINQSINKQTKFQIQAAKANVDAVVATSSAMMAMNQKNAEASLNMLSNINNSLQALIKYNNENMSQYISASMTYYEMMGRVHAPREKTGGGSNRLSGADLIDKRGNLNTGNLGKLLRQNLKDTYESTQFGEITSLLGSMGDELVANPLKILSSTLIREAIPKAVKSATANLDKTFGNFITELIMKSSDTLKASEGKFSGIKQFLGNVLDINVDRVKEFKTGGRVTTDAAVFDGITRHAITAEIPKYLRESTEYLKQLVILNGGDPTKAIANSNIFNRETGRYQRYEDFSKELLGSINEAVTASMGNSDFGKSLKKIGNNRNLISEDRQEAFDALLNKFFLALEKEDKARLDLSKTGPDSDIGTIIGSLSGDSRLKSILETSVYESFKHGRGGINLNSARLNAKRERNRRIGELEEANLSELSGLVKPDQTIDEALASVIYGSDGRVTRTQAYAPNSLLGKISSIEEILDRGINVKILKGAPFKSRTHQYSNSETSDAKPSQTHSSNATSEKELSPEEIARAVNETYDSDQPQVDDNKKGSKFVINTQQHLGNAMHHILKGDPTKAYAEIGAIFGSGLRSFGKSINDAVIDPLKKTMFGEDENGKAVSITSKVKEMFTGLKDDVVTFVLGPKDKDGKREGTKTSVKDFLHDGMDKWTKSLFGPEKSFDDVKKEVTEKLRKNSDAGIKGAVAGAGLGIASGGILGTLVGGPLTGAILGTATGILSRSEGFQKMVFGDKMVDEIGPDGKPTGKKVRDGGIISADVRKFFKDNKSSFVGSSAIGAIGGAVTGGGLLGSLVGGPIAGALLGTGVSMVTKSKAFTDFIYGKETDTLDENGKKKRIGGILNSFNGFFKKNGGESSEKRNAKNIASMATVGTGAGLLAGFFTPLGPIGGAALGLASSMFASKDKFHDMLFGSEEDREKDGNHGLVNKLGAVINNVVLKPLGQHAKDFVTDAKDAVVDKLLDPLENFLGPMMGWAKSIQDRIGDKIDDVFGSLKDGFKNVTKNLAGFVGTAFSKLMKTLFGERAKKLKEKITSIPGKLLNKAGDHIRKKNEARSLKRWNSDRFRNDPRNKAIFDQVQSEWDNLSDSEKAEKYDGDFQKFSDAKGRKFFYNAEDTRAIKLESKLERAATREKRRAETKRLNDQGSLVALLTGGEFSDVNEETKAKALEAFKRSKAYAKGKGKGGFSNEQILDLLSPDAKVAEKQQESVETAKENLDVSWKQLTALEKIQMMLSDVFHFPKNAVKSGTRAVSDARQRSREKKVQNKLEFYRSEADMSNSVSSLHELVGGKTYMDGFTMSNKEARQMRSMAKHDDEFGEVARESLRIIDDPNSSNDERKEALQNFRDAREALEEKKKNDKGEHYERIGDFKSSKAGVSDARRRKRAAAKRGYATGTNNAKEGFAVVGENGPEIVRFGGGEKVLSNNSIIKVKLVDVDPNAAKVMNDHGTQDVNIIGQTGPIVTYGTAAKLDHKTDSKSAIEKALKKPNSLVSYDQIKSDNDELSDETGSSKDKEGSWLDKLKDTFGSLGKLLLGGGAIVALLKLLSNEKVQNFITGLISGVGGIASDAAKDVAFVAENDGYEGGANFTTNVKNQTNRWTSMFSDPKTFLLGEDGEADSQTAVMLKGGRQLVNRVLNGAPGTQKRGFLNAITHPIATAKNAIRHPFKTLGSIGSGIKNAGTKVVSAGRGIKNFVANPNKLGAIKDGFVSLVKKTDASKQVGMVKDLFTNATQKGGLSGSFNIVKDAVDGVNPKRKGLSGFLFNATDKLNDFAVKHGGTDAQKIVGKLTGQGLDEMTPSMAKEMVEKTAKYGLKEGAGEATEAAVEKGAKAAAAKVLKEGAGEAVEATAEKVAKESTLSAAGKAIKGALQTAGDVLAKKVKGSKAGTIIKSAIKVVDDVIEKITKGMLGKLKSWILKKLAKLATFLGITTGVAATGIGALGVLAKDGVFLLLGALNNSGKGGAARLFRCTQDAVDWKMKAISAAIGGFAETTVGTIIDIINEIYCAITGDDFLTHIASALYDGISSKEDSAKLDASQEKLKVDYKEYQDKVYEKEYKTYIAENPNSKLTLDQYKQKVESGEIDVDVMGFSEYVDDTNKTFGAKIWSGVKKLFGGKGNKTKEPSPKTSSPSDAIVNTEGGMGSGIPFYSQKDPRWGNMSYERGGAGDTIGNAGCGPTAFAMAATGATGRNIDPVQAAAMMKRVGARDETGTNWGGIGRAADMYGIDSRMERHPSAGFIDSELDAGNPVILSGRTGGYGNTPYTPQGHYVVATGRDSNGNYIINDPNKSTGSMKYKKSDMLAETGAAWGLGGRGPAKNITIVNDGYRGSKSSENTTTTREKWLQIVSATKKAIASAKAGYSQTNWINVTVGGKTLSVRTDCSGFVCACLKFFGVMDDSANMSSHGYTEKRNATLLKAGFSSGPFYSWENLKPGDIVAKNGHVEIFAGMIDGEPYVYNCGNDSTCNNPDATKASFSTYTTIWEPGPPGSGVVNATEYTASSADATATSVSSSSSSSGSNFFSKLTTFFSELGSRAITGITTGNWNTDWSGVFDDNNSSTSVSSSSGSTSTSSSSPTVVTTGSPSEKELWNLLKNKGLTNAGVAGVMGNLFVESGLRTNNVQNSYESKVGSDEEYTTKVDNGSYNNFVNDSVGYGLAQWTYSTRKKALLDLARSKGKSIADGDVQTTHLLNELTGSYKGVYDKLRTTSSVKDASDIFMTQFERPADQSSSAKNTRSGYAQSYYNKYAVKPAISTPKRPSNPRFKNTYFTGMGGGYGEGSATSTGVMRSQFNNRVIASSRRESSEMNQVVQYLSQILQVLGESSDKLNALNSLKDIAKSGGNSFTSNTLYTQNTNNSTTSGTQVTASKTNPTKYAIAEKIARGGL